MAEHNIYLGGGRVANLDYAMFPSAAVNATQEVQAATHKNAQYVWLNRILDPTNDKALGAYIAKTPTADDANEVWNSAVIPQSAIIHGHYYRIVTPVTGLVFTLRLKNIQTAAATVIAAAVSGAAVSEGWVSAGLGLVGLSPFNQLLQFVPTAVPVGGILGMRIEIGTLFTMPFRGQW